MPDVYKNLSKLELQKPVDISHEDLIKATEGCDKVNPNDCEEFLALDAKHQQVLIYLMAGLKQSETARMLGMSRASISGIKRREDFKKAWMAASGDKYEKMIENSGNVRRHLDQLSIKAVLTLGKLIGQVEDGEVAPTDVPYAVQKGAAKDLLEMAGHKAADRISMEIEEEKHIVVSDPLYKFEDDPFLENNPDKEKILAGIKAGKEKEEFDENEWNDGE